MQSISEQKKLHFTKRLKSQNESVEIAKIRDKRNEKAFSQAFFERQSSIQKAKNYAERQKEKALKNSLTKQSAERKMTNFSFIQALQPELDNKSSVRETTKMFIQSQEESQRKMTQRHTARSPYVVVRNKETSPGSLESPKEGPSVLLIPMRQQHSLTKPIPKSKHKRKIFQPILGNKNK